MNVINTNEDIIAIQEEEKSSSDLISTNKKNSHILVR